MSEGSHAPRQDQAEQQWHDDRQRLDRDGFLRRVNHPEGLGDALEAAKIDSPGGFVDVVQGGW